MSFLFIFLKICLSTDIFNQLGIDKDKKIKNCSVVLKRLKREDLIGLKVETIIFLNSAFEITKLTIFSIKKKISPSDKELLGFTKNCERRKFRESKNFLNRDCSNVLGIEKDKKIKNCSVVLKKLRREDLIGLKVNTLF